MDGQSIYSELLCGEKEIYCKNQISNLILKPAGKHQNQKVSTEIFSKCNVFEIIIDNKESPKEETWKYGVSFILLNVIKRIRKSFRTWEFHLDGIRYKPPEEDEKKFPDETAIGDMLQLSIIVNEEKRSLIIPHRDESLND